MGPHESAGSSLVRIRILFDGVRVYDTRSDGTLSRKIRQHIHNSTLLDLVEKHVPPFRRTILYFSTHGMSLTMPLANDNNFAVSAGH